MVVDFRAFGSIPEADRKGPRPALRHESHFILESLQFSQHWDDFRIKLLRKLHNAVRFQVHMTRRADTLAPLPRMAA